MATAAETRAGGLCNDPNHFRENIRQATTSEGGIYHVKRKSNNVFFLCMERRGNEKCFCPSFEHATCPSGDGNHMDITNIILYGHPQRGKENICDFVCLSASVNIPWFMKGEQQRQVCLVLCERERSINSQFSNLIKSHFSTHLKSIVAANERHRGD